MLQVKLRFFLQSPGVLAEPWQREPKPLPFFQSWFTRAGWRRKRERMMGGVNRALAAGDRTALRQLVTESFYTSLKRELKERDDAGWAKVKWELSGPLKSIKTLQARMIGVDRSNTDNAFVQLTLSIRSSQKCAAYGKRGQVVAGDMDQEVSNPEDKLFDEPSTVASWPPQARAAAMTSMLGCDTQLDVEDVWVFEKPLLVKEERWRLAGRLRPS
eukprot:SM000226S07427  [mRNA]  locus=s226:111270:113315:- [translate_table: standard]